MDNVSKVRIFAVVLVKMVVSIFVFVYALGGLYMLCTKYAGLPFPRSLYGLLLCGGGGAIVGYAFRSFRKRTDPEARR
jgi:hypothetical protein